MNSTINLPACHQDSPQHAAYVARVEELEAEGCDTSDAQGIADMEFDADQLNRAASLMKAALARLDIEPGVTTASELAADDAEIMPALVDGQTVTTPENNSGMSEGLEI